MIVYYIMDKLNEYFRKSKSWICEGHIGRNKNQIQKLTELCKEHKFKTILEIGFNAGHSTALMLENTDAEIVSVDIGGHPYTFEGKDVIDEVFPNRHLLIIGNSMDVLAKDEIPDLKYDLIYIDGGHSYKCAKSDLVNCKKYASPDTMVIIDDIVYDPEYIKPWNKQVVKVWNEKKDAKFVKETDYFYFGKGQGFAIGKYIF
jgi:predicted O-methyltransferase YrrM